ncbi:tetratricopeptide repeat protein [Paenibacillus sp. S150]|uniref:tetratricopeptide repeat protein n=1 Tax=Paenibacillus sp. S150 TaxID=2749826 RepID=UPI001C55A5AE|nr:tetratricopeptide repeat protein [Paenibacillus sp. S150]MBW4083026.1 tetratricopeptide repeat protein [Paenibacillus sp. S150]
MEKDSRQTAFAAVHQLIGWKRYKEALAEAEQLLRQEPEDPDAFALMAHICSLMNEYEKALHWAKEALLREPQHELAWYVRVCVYYETDNEKALEETLREAMRVDPYEAHYYFLQANRLNKKAKYKESRGLLLQALELRPENPLYLAALSYTEALLGNMAESARVDAVAAGYDAENAYVLLYLAWAAGQRGDYKLKEVYMKNAVRLSPDNRQLQDEFLEALQQRQKLFRIFLWPTRLVRRMKRWQIILAWMFAWILFRPLVLLFIVLYVLANWVTKGIVHVQVFGWRRRGS